ncbi:WG repeat-containing protein [uncultured Psychroserpens sp.]|uniref:WG repeat-containing protein n=1 Tax=uncultured Psychroserpens sp. TaxID=255436 RepID=UPI0026353CD0|nr:WG repeat-containing protein [uncultured Psychroserpens sp.]
MKALKQAIFTFLILLYVNMLSAQQFEIFYDFETKLYQLQDGQTGELRPETYENIEYNREGNYIIKTKEGSGLLNAYGDILLEPVYDRISTYGKYDIARKNYYLTEVYNSKFEKILEGAYSNVYLKDNVLYVTSSKTKKRGVLDSLGAIILPLEYDYVKDYYPQDTERFVCIKGGKHGVVDYNNEVVIPFIYDDILLFNNDYLDPQNLDVIEPEKMYSVVKNISNTELKIGVIDYQGTTLVPLDYSNGYPIFTHDLFAMGKDNKFGYVDIKNEVKIPFIYDEALPFYYEVASVKKNNRYGVINENNDVIIPFDVYRSHFVFTHGLSKFSLNHGKYGLINTKGEIVIPQIYDTIEYVVLGRYFRVKKDGKSGIVNLEGKEIIPPKYSFVQTLFKDEEHNKTYYFVGIDGKNGVVDENDTVVLDFKYRYVGKYEDFIVISTDNKHGILDLEFKELIPPKYPKMRIHSKNWISVGDDEGRSFNIDLSGNITTKF